MVAVFGPSLHGTIPFGRVRVAPRERCCGPDSLSGKLS
jgi:hypothetical protein